jgi:predicted DNA-binding protein
MISIRLSDEEYTGLKRLCSATGARSVSDLAREAMRVLLNGVTREDTLGTRMDEVHSQVRSLNRKIEELSARLQVNGGPNWKPQ